MAGPGWYPIEGGAERWWNGSEWTAQVRRPADPSARPELPPPVPRRRRRIGLVGSGGAIVLIGALAAITPTKVDPAEESVSTSTTALATTATAATDPAPTEEVPPPTTAVVEPAVDPLTGCNVDVVGGDWIADLDPACVTPFPWDLDNDQPLLVCRGETGVALLNLNRYPDDDLVMPINDAGRKAMVAGDLVLVDVNVATPLDVDPSVAATLAIAAEWLCVGATGCKNVDELVFVYRRERPAWSQSDGNALVCKVVAE